MLWYLHVCSEKGIIVEDYTDFPEGMMVENDDGSGQFTKVILQPQVIIQKVANISLAKDLHAQANNYCFIANSCNFPIIHQPVIRSVE